MAGIFYKLYHPEIFQGHLLKQKYFEGWYFKLVSADEKYALAVIPGIAIYDQNDRHGFIQVINGVSQTSSYYKFPLEEFSAASDELYISIGDNHFSKDGLTLDLPELKGEIQISNITSLTKTLISPGIMGWYSFVPTMECYHGIVSLYHQLAGYTEGNAGAINWNNGTGYIEKDWGKSFPKCWIWIHSNHFHGKSRAALMASVAHIPWKGRYFPGFIVVLLINGKQYRFATYNGSRMKCSVLEKEVKLEFQRKDLHLNITAHRAPTAVLRSPITGQMTGKVNESLQAKVEVILYQSSKEIWRSLGTTAGLEVAGDTTILESDSWRK